MAVANWICDGVPKDSNQYPNQNPQGQHEPYENFGADCVMCSLPKEALGGGRKSSPVPIAAIVAVPLVLAALGGGYWLFSHRPTTTTNPSPPISTGTVSPSPNPSPPIPTGTVSPSPNPSPPIPTGTVSPSPNPSPPISGAGSVSPSSPTVTYPTFDRVPNVPDSIVRYGGSTSFAPLRSPAIVAKIQQAHPKFILTYIEPTPPQKPGSGSGIGMLIDGQLSMAQSSRPLKDEELAKAKDRGVKLEQVPVAVDGIAIYVNPQMSIVSLNMAQLKDIFTGKITNWREVGGANLPIVPVSRDPEDGGSSEYFADKVMAKKAFAPSARPYARDTTASLRKIAAIPGAIGYATASEVCNQSKVKALPIAKAAGQSPIASCNGQQVNKVDFAKNVYPITRRLFVIIKRDGKLDEQAGVSYTNLLLSDEGQQSIEQAGLIRLRLQ